MKFALEPDEPPADGLIRLMRGQVRKLRLMSPDDADFVRRARVTAKRLRAALQLCRPMISRKAFRRTETWWRDAARGLSDERDRLARFEAMGRLRSALAERVDPRLVDDLAERFREIALPSQLKLDLPQPGPRAGADFHAAAADAPTPDPSAIKDQDAAYVMSAYLKTYRRARKAMRRAVRSGNVEAYHDWRKLAKRHALQTRVLRRLAPAIEDRVRPTRDLAERLGELQDLSVTIAALETMPDPPGGASGRNRLIEAMTALQKDAMRAARVDGRPVFKSTPRGLAARLAISSDDENALEGQTRPFAGGEPASAAAPPAAELGPAPAVMGSAA